MNRNPKFEGNGVRFDIPNAELFYAKVTPDNLDEYEGKKRYKVTLRFDKELMEKFEDAGMNVKETEDGDKVIDTFRNYEYAKSKELLPPPVLVFADGTKYDPSEHGLIGNGTKATVSVSSKYIKVGKNWYLPLYLDKITFTDFVSYGGEKASVEDLF